MSVSGGASGSGVSSVIGDSCGEGPMLAEKFHTNIFYFTEHSNNDGIFVILFHSMKKFTFKNISSLKFNFKFNFFNNLFLKNFECKYIMKAHYTY